MAGIEGKKYLGKLVFKKGSTVKNIYIAKFLFGTKANGGYYDTSGVANISNATTATAAAIRTKICQEFSLDEIEAVWKDGYAQGFIGLVKQGGSLINYHDMTRRAGHKLTKNGATYVALNDAGLHVKGTGNVVFNVLFDNHVEGYAVLNGTFYDSCTFTFQYSLDNSTWYTYASISSQQVPAKGQQIPPISDLPNISGQGSSTAKLWWRLVATNDEGTINIGSSLNLKPSAKWYQAEVFSALNSNTYSGNGQGGQSLFFYISDYSAIISACRDQTIPLPWYATWTAWSRGQKRAVTAESVGLPDMYIYGSWEALYKGGSTNALKRAGYYLLTKNYGIQANSSGKITYIFYAYEAGGLNVTIRLTASFYRTYSEETGLYSLAASVRGEYIGGTATDPSTTTTIVVSCRFSGYNGGPAAPATIYGQTQENYKEDTLTVEPGGGTGMGAFFAGYTDYETVQGCQITVKSNTSNYTASVVYA